MKPIRLIAFAMLAALAPAVTAQAADLLPSWNDGAARHAIIEFVQATTDKASPKFVPLEDRIATFDLDGTLWVEDPMYAQVMYYPVNSDNSHYNTSPFQYKRLTGAH